LKRRSPHTKEKVSAQALEEIQIMALAHGKKVSSECCAFELARGGNEATDCKINFFKRTRKNKKLLSVDDEPKEQSTILSLRKQRKVVPNQE
jgi:uncharacterized protein YjhX (UPF0386 family)